MLLKMRVAPLHTAARLGVMFVAILTLSACATSSAVIPKPPTAPDLSKLVVTGYAVAGETSSEQLAASSAPLSIVGVDGVNITMDGANITPLDSGALTLLKSAHDRGKRAELLVGNFDGEMNDFSPRIGDELLGSAANRASVIADLVAEVRADGWDGVTVDLENLKARDRDGLSSFIRDLRSTLGTRSVSVCIMATTGSYNKRAYDLRAIGAAADRVVLMAYDQHGPTWSTAGPVGGLPWVKTTLEPLVRDIPKGKIQLGIAGYGYSWPRASTPKVAGQRYSDAAARKLAGSRAVWDTAQAEWHATLADGTRLWWSDARSIAARAALARQLGLGGAAVWNLTDSDPL
jgi:spore germination protein